jgi:hypothetical protein
VCVLSIPAFERALPPVVLGEILSVSAFSLASTQDRPNFSAITGDTPASVAEPPPILWQFSGAYAVSPVRNELLDAVGVEPFGSDTVNPNGMGQLCEIAYAKGRAP